MALFSKETLLKQVDKNLTKTVKVSHPTEGPGEIVIRRVCSTLEQELLNEKSERMLSLKKAGEPSYQKYADSAFLSAVYLANFMVEPKLEVEEVLEMTESIGPIVNQIFGEIMKFSGATQDLLNEGAAALEKKPFPDDDAPGVSRVGPTAD